MNSPFFDEILVEEYAEGIVLDHLSADLEYLTTVEVLAEEGFEVPEKDFEEFAEAVHVRAESILRELAASHAMYGFTVV